MADTFWHPYPATRPPREGYFLVTLSHGQDHPHQVRTMLYDFDLGCFFYDRVADRRIIAWADLPKPYLEPQAKENSHVCQAF